MLQATEVRARRAAVALDTRDIPAQRGVVEQGHARGAHDPGTRGDLAVVADARPAERGTLVDQDRADAARLGALRLTGHSLLCFVAGRGRHTSWPRDWSSDVCSSDLSGSMASP